MGGLRTIILSVPGILGTKFAAKSRGGRRMKQPQRRISLFMAILIVIVFGQGPELWAKVWARVSGTVTAEDGKPLAGVRVILVSPDGEKQETATDDKGNWRLVNVRPGSWEIGFLAKGFEPRNFKIELSAIKDNPPVNIKMARVSESPFTVADALYKDHKYQEARQEYQRVLEAQPELYEAHVRIGLCYYQLDDLENALTFFKRALEKMPPSPDVLINLAAIYLQRGDLEQGIQYIRQLDEKSITDPSLFYNIGALFFKEGHTDLAIEYLQKCLTVDDKYLEGYYQLGLAFLNKGNGDEAKKCFQKVVELAPESEKADFAKKILEGIR
jgi:Tfp pilus assembly protein PilF